MLKNNDMKQLPPFYVGQKIVCIKDHSSGAVKKGQHFIVMNVEKFCCDWLVDIGILNDHPSMECNYCGMKIMSQSFLFSQTLFAPEEQFAAITFTKVIEKELVSQN